MAIEAPNQANVSGYKPGILGAVSRAPLGTVVPTDPTIPLSEIPEVESFGFIGESGVTFAPNREEGSDKAAFGGTVVQTTGGTYAPSATFTILEFTRLTVLKALFGERNVTVDAGGHIKIIDRGETGEPCVLIFEFRTGVNTVERKVVDYAVFKTDGDRVLDNESLGEIELTYSFRMTEDKYSTTEIAEVVDGLNAEAAAFGVAANASVSEEPISTKK